MTHGLRVRAALASLSLAFNPGQRRGPDGRWVKMGGAGSAGPSRKAGERAAGKSGMAVDVLRFLAEQGEGREDTRFYDADDLPPETVKWAEQLFDFQDPQTGFRTKVTRVRASAPPPPDADGIRRRGIPNLEAVVEIQDSTGKKVGIADRRLMYDRATGKKVRVSHLTFRMDKDAQGGGFSSRWLRQMEERYREAGVDQVVLTAADKVGGYAWAKAGFDFDSEYASARDVATRMEKTLRAIVRGGGQLSSGVVDQGKELARRARSADPDDHPTPMEFAMLGWTPGATTWPGKQTMLGSVWEGVKEL